jgi:hypothetical protein
MKRIYNSIFVSIHCSHRPVGYPAAKAGEAGPFNVGVSEAYSCRKTWRTVVISVSLTVGRLGSSCYNVPPQVLAMSWNMSYLAEQESDEPGPKEISCDDCDANLILRYPEGRSTLT